MTFGEKVTGFDKFLDGTYGYVLRLSTAPSIKEVLSVQVKNGSTISEVTETLSTMNQLMQYPIISSTVKVAMALESGVLYLYLDLTTYPYETDTEFFLRAFRYPNEITELNSLLDISPGDVELFIALSIAVAAEGQGKLVPQRILDKIDYLKNVISLEQS